MNTGQMISWREHQSVGITKAVRYFQDELRNSSTAEMSSGGLKVHSLQTSLDGPT